MKRTSGVLLPIFSLPSRYGAGCFSRAAYDFIDRLHEAGQHAWQILPLNPAGKGDSPYMSDAGFAGNHYFIDPEDLASQGLLTKSELDEAAASYAAGRAAARTAASGEAAPSPVSVPSPETTAASCSSPITDEHTDSPEGPDPDPSHIDYPLSNQIRDQLYRKAFRRWRPKTSDHPSAQECADAAEPGNGEAESAFQNFCTENRYWLRDACLFCIIQKEQNDAPWSSWPEGLRTRDEAALEAFAEEHEDEMLYQAWLQYEFQSEWDRIRKYAAASGIRIIGDIPIYVALESADCWAHPEIFQLSEDGRPTAVAGCPPDAFSAKGQLWGNPLYDWDKNREKTLEWWIHRIHRTSSFYDITRIDHFRGLASYYAIPADAEDALSGEWKPGPGMELFRRIRAELGDLPFIAEDLGFLTDDVYKLLEDSGCPGMKVLQFAFDGGADNPYLPANYTSDNAAVYTGTHDNDTSRGWYQSLSDGTKDLVSRTLSVVRRGDSYRIPTEYVTPLLSRLALQSRCRLAVVPMQDWLNLGSEARLNTPGTAYGNWRWQMGNKDFTPDLADEMRRMTEEYGRA